MITQSQKLRLGVFLIISALLLVIALVVVSAPKFLEKRDQYYIEYVDVSVGGLDAGTPVKYHGIRVGRVEDVYVDPEDITKIKVVVSLRKGTPIVTDTEAVIASIGITGLKYIELTGGTKESDKVEPGGRITAGQSLFESLSDRAEVMALKLDVILKNVSAFTDEEHRRVFKNTIDSIERLVTQVNALIEENREQVHVTTRNAAVISERLIQVSDHLNRIMAGDAVRETLAHIHAISGRLRSEVDSLQIRDTVANLDRLITNADQTVTHIDLTILRSREDIMHSLADLQESIENLKEATTLIRQDPSILLRGSKSVEIEE
ncbi:MAG: MCE family protein [Candidatus Latescibacteria bacterium]|nr:MCE family protein [Candidatus Latescibacterota bacterium]